MASEKPAEKPAAPAEESKDAAPKKKGGMKLIIAGAVVVVLEIGTVFVTAKMAGGPKQATAAPPTSAPAETIEKEVEVKLIDARLPNAQRGPLYLYDLAVVAKVAEKDKEEVTKAVAEREAEIKDQIRTIIASSDPKSLAEPGLETLRRQISFQLEHDIGKDLIKEILIPKCTPQRYE
jgi:flagellar basal body-associated protein FliL